jgi:hypothetical protein
VGAEEPTGRALLEQGIDFPMRHHIERWQRREMLKPRDPPVFTRPAMPTTVEPERWSHGIEVHERELPPELFQDLRERTPQALLRDLHRPVMQFFVELQLIEGTEVIGQLSEEFHKVRRARNREARPHVEPTVVVFGEAQRRRRAFLAQPWQPVIPDDQPRHGAIIRPEAEMEKEEFYRPDFAKYGR